MIYLGVHPFRRQMGHFLTDMNNLQLGLRQTQALINTYHIILIHHHRQVIHHWKLIQLAASWITFQYFDRR